TMAARPIVYLIDGSSQMYRAYHAPVRTADGGLLRNAKGQPTNAVYIFVTMLRKLLNEHKPQYIAASFDLPGRTFRDDLAGGDKGARELIAQYGTLDNLIEHAREIKNKRYREGLLGNTDAARQSQELARIRTSVPVDFEPDSVRYRGGSRERSFQIFNELGFRSLAKEYAPTAGTISKTYRMAATPEDVRALAGRLRTAGRFALRVLP